MSREPATDVPDDRSHLLAAMKRYWGYDEFLPLQFEAMSCVLNGRDSVVVLPTGGGKSLCFQAPAMCVQGLAVVVSPLISLMKDQVDALRNCGVPAAAANSQSTMAERQYVAREIRSGRLRLLYVSPERLVGDRTLEFLSGILVSMFAIDEAHCISAWGHDFRPEYRMLRVLRERFPNVAIHAYTATATEQVRQDIAEQLRLREPAFHIGSFDRPNLVYRVRRREGMLGQVRQVVARHPQESGIVYCLSRKDVDKTAAALRELGYRALPYHAGMGDADRQRNQDAFIQEQCDVIVATVAFGMGIDKSNIRYVVHAGMPKSIEHYQQESGRAGRDGLEAECCLFYSPADVMQWKGMLSDMPEAARDGSERSLNAMYDFCSSVTCRHRALLRHFGQDLSGDRCNACDVCLGDLDTVADALVTGQKILSCVLRLKERFGAGYTTLVLCGSQDERIVARGHDRLSTWGLLAQDGQRAVRDWIEQLVSQQFLEKEGEYQVLRVTPAGRGLLRGEATPQLLRPVAKKKSAAVAPAESWEGVDRELFDSLRALRQEHAQRQGVPAYVVFHDATLRELARRRPATTAAFGAIRGVGECKRAAYGDSFVTHIAEYCRAKNLAMDVVPPPVRSEAAVATPSAGALASFPYFRQKLSVHDVAAQMGRATSTVLDYLTAFLRFERVVDPTPWVSQAVVAQVRDAAEQVGLGLLKPIFDRLGGRIPYDDIRIVVECMRNESVEDRPAD
jgi:ATP-dependent DNA helicase RecQ